MTVVVRERSRGPESSGLWRSAERARAPDSLHPVRPQRRAAEQPSVGYGLSRCGEPSAPAEGDTERVRGGSEPPVSFTWFGARFVPLKLTESSSPPQHPLIRGTSLVKSARGAVSAFRSIRFPEPLPEPGGRLSARDPCGFHRWCWVSQPEVGRVAASANRASTSTQPDAEGVQPGFSMSTNSTGP
jgi:hypothetical protein